MAEPIDVTELAGRARQGDGAAFGELYKRSWGLTYVYVSGQVADKEEARSIAQEAYTVAWAKIATLRDPAAFPGFIRTIARRIVQESGKRRIPVSADPAANRPDGASRDPAGSAERADLERAAFRALEELEPLHREAILLRYCEGLKFREVAARLGIGTNQAAGIIARGLVRLAERLDPDRRTTR